MKVKDLIKIEETWLLYQEKHKFTMDFNSYILLLKKLKEVGEITHQYFLLMTEYDAYLKNSSNTEEDRKIKLSIFNEKILNSDIDFSFPECNMDFFINKEKK